MLVCAVLAHKLQSTSVSMNMCTSTCADYFACRCTPCLHMQTLRLPRRQSARRCAGTCASPSRATPWPGTRRSSPSWRWPRWSACRYAAHRSSLHVQVNFDRAEVGDLRATLVVVSRLAGICSSPKWNACVKPLRAALRGTQSCIYLSRRDANPEVAVKL